MYTTHACRYMCGRASTGLLYKNIREVTDFHVDSLKYGAFTKHVFIL